MKKNLRKSILLSTMAFACVFGATTLINNDVKVKADQAGAFEMVPGASIRIAEDGKYGIRYIASLGVKTEDAITSTYGENSSFHVMIIPEVYYDTYLDELEEGADYYQALYNALYNETTNPTPYIATMKAQPFLPSADNTQLEKDVYHVQGSLTTIQYNNLNRDFIGLAYYEYEETTGEGDAAQTTTKRVYADFSIEDARNVVKVASGVLNDGEYDDGSEEDGILDGFIRQGINQANGEAEANKNNSVDELLNAISVPDSKKTLNKENTSFAVENLPEGVELEVVQSLEEGQTVIDADQVKNGVIAPTAFGETTITTKVLGKTYTTKVQSYKKDDWTFDIDEGYDAYYDYSVTGRYGEGSHMVAFDASGKRADSSADLESGGYVIEDGYLKFRVNDDWRSIVFFNSNKLKNYTAGEYVYTQIRMKFLKSDGTDGSWDSKRIYAFPGENNNGLVWMHDENGKASGNHTLSISAVDSEGFRTFTWYTTVTDYYQSTMNSAKAATDTTALNFAGLNITDGWAGETLVIDWIKTDKVITSISANNVVATTTTYGGKANTAHTTSTVVSSNEALDVSKLSLVSNNTDVVTIGEGNVLTAGATAGTATVSVGYNGFDKIVDGTFTVDVYTAINCKYDLDMLALAWARDVYGTAWNKDAKYLLTQTIDYNGDIFFPIAACIGRHFGSYVIGKQWKTILADETTYGLSYETFASRGLNTETNETVDDTLNFKFQATLNGNGYAIKNAKLMYDASGLVQGGGFGVTTNMIGALGANGKVENLSVENLGIQTPSEAGYELNTQYTLDGYNGSSAQTISIANNNVKGCLVGAFGYIAGGTIEDCYINVDFGSTTFNAIMMVNFAFGWLETGTINNTIIKLNYTASGEIFGLNTWSVDGATISNVALIDNTAQGIQGAGMPNGLVYMQNDGAFKSQVESGAINAEAFTAWDTDLTDKNLFVLKEGVA